VMDTISQAYSSCLNSANLFDVGPAPSSCIEGGWAGGQSTIPRACFRLQDQWCRAVLEKDKKFAACMSEVAENNKKKEIMREVILHQDPDRPTTSSDDEIDNAFNAIKSTGITQGQNDAVQKYEETGVDMIKAMEKQAFSELDNAFRQADFDELTQAYRDPASAGSARQAQAAAKRRQRQAMQQSQQESADSQGDDSNSQGDYSTYDPNGLATFFNQLQTIMNQSRMPQNTRQPASPATAPSTNGPSCKHSASGAACGAE